jgi:hypothetical protein
LDTRDCNGPDLDAPFPWFGGKRRVAPWVWQAFGEVGNAGRGVHRTRVHLGGSCVGMGVHRKKIHERGENGLYAWMLALAERLRYVRVCCGDWTRVMGPAVTMRSPANGVFLDPPYTRTERTKDIYTQESDVAEAVRDWATHHGDNPALRIVLCGYEGEHEMPDTWRQIAWKTHGGYGNNGEGLGRDNKDRERLWLSPHCQPVGDEAVGQLSLLDMLAKKAETG